MLLVDTKEHGALVEKLTKALEVKRVSLDAGDFLIPKEQGFVLIERSTFSDFIGKIKSDRLWDQIERCKKISDDVYLLLENPYTLKFSKFNRTALWSMVTVVSRQVKLMFAMNTYDSYVFIKKLYDTYNVKRDVQEWETRSKPKAMTTQEQAKFVLMGLAGVGEGLAVELLKNRSIAELSLLDMGALEEVIRPKTIHDKVARRIAMNLFEVFHQRC